MIDGPTLAELFAGLGPVKFWVCPDHRDGRVEWTGRLARCLTCNRVNSGEVQP